MCALYVSQSPQLLNMQQTECGYLPRRHKTPAIRRTLNIVCFLTDSFTECECMCRMHNRKKLKRIARHIDALPETFILGGRYRLLGAAHRLFGGALQFFCCCYLLLLWAVMYAPCMLVSFGDGDPFCMSLASLQYTCSMCSRMNKPIYTIL